MEATVWLILTILPILLLVSLAFFLLGRRSARGIPSPVLADKEAIILREQTRVDETVRKLDAAEEQIKDLSAQHEAFQQTYEELQHEYENLKHTTVSRRRLSQMESIIYRLHREKNHLLVEFGRETEPMPDLTPEPQPPQKQLAAVPSPPKPDPTPETILQPIPETIPDPVADTVLEPSTESIPAPEPILEALAEPTEPPSDRSETANPADLPPVKPPPAPNPKGRGKKHRR